MISGRCRTFTILLGAGASIACNRDLYPPLDQLLDAMLAHATTAADGYEGRFACTFPSRF